MESIVNDRLRKHIFDLKFITSRQFGFRSNYFTFDLLTSTTQNWTNLFGKGQDVKVAALYIS